MSTEIELATLNDIADELMTRLNTTDYVFWFNGTLQLGNGITPEIIQRVIADLVNVFYFETGQTELES